MTGAAPFSNKKHQAVSRTVGSRDGIPHDGIGHFIPAGVQIRPKIAKPAKDCKFSKERS